MSQTLNQILAIIRSVMDEKQKLDQILEFLENEIMEQEEEEFENIEVPEKFKPCVAEIAGSIDAGLVCFFNPETLEIDSYPRDLLYEIDLFDDDPEEVKKNLLELYDWEDVKVLDWEHYFEFSPPDSNESFRTMEAFAERLKNADKLKNKLINALNNRKSFANFKNIIDNSEHRQDWFDFKFRWLENSVGAQLMEELENLENKPKFESGIYNDDGTKVDESTIPTPNLCIICKKHISDDWEEDILCKMNRHDQRDDLDNFRCGAFEKM